MRASAAIIGVLFAAVAVACAARSSTPRLAPGAWPDLYAWGDSCRVPPSPVPLQVDSSRRRGARTLEVTVASSGSPGWAGDVFLRLLGPFDSSAQDRRIAGHEGFLRVTGLPPGRYVARIGAIGHYPRVDTLEVRAGGLALRAPLAPTPSHFCGSDGYSTRGTGSAASPA